MSTFQGGRRGERAKEVAKIQEGLGENQETMVAWKPRDR